MQVGLLGPVDLVVDGASRPVRGLRRRAVLAVLALHRGEVVGTDRLIDAVWGDDAPATSTNTLQSHVSYLRRLLGDKSAIVARPPGYLLNLGTEATDVQVAERLIQQGQQSIDPTDRARQLEAALALWRGPPLADVAGLAWLDEQAEILNQLWLQATRALIDAKLTLGEHLQLLPELARLAHEHPFDERIHGQLMLALYRAGRQADALAAYHRLRHNLDDDLGIEPSQPLRDLQASMLNQDPALDPAAPRIAPAPAATSAAAPAPAASVPAQLPLAAPAFAGRTRELADLDALLPRTGQAAPTAVVISALSGTAGVGKTALALHWAHRVADRFPDGQLYVNLRGFDPIRPALDPAEAVRRFLDALDVPAERIPADLDAQTALYRSRLAGRRMLIVLDNARDSAQVRPLLPGAPSALVLVTSRRQLTGLVAADGAHPVTLDVLTFDEARELLARRSGAERVAAEPAAVQEIITRCARLPLALAILAARAATRPQLALHTLAAELRERRDRLDALRGDDPDSDVWAVFSWSYGALTPPAARLFRLLGPHPGPDLSAPAAASLAALPLREVRPLLAELGRANLIVEHNPGRYTFHDLLRAYATDLTQRIDTEEQRRAATHRTLDHYLHTAYAADRLLEPARDPLTLAPPQPGVTPAPLADSRQALAWFTAEHLVLVAAVDQAGAGWAGATGAGAGWDTHAWQLPWTMATYFYRHGHWHDQSVIGHVAVAAADRLADPSAQAMAHRIIAGAHYRLGRLDDAHAELGQALELGRRAGDQVGQAHTLQYLASVWEEQGRHLDALEHDRQALDLYRAAGHRYGQANALNKVGWDHAQLGDHEQALTYCEQALILLEELGDRVGQAGTWDSIGYAHHHLGHHREAVSCYEHALNLYRDLGDRYLEADTSTHLGDAHYAAGSPDAARDAWQRALSILHHLEHPDAANVRARLTAVDTCSSAR